MGSINRSFLLLFCLALVGAAGASAAQAALPADGPATVASALEAASSASAPGPSTVRAEATFRRTLPGAATSSAAGGAAISRTPTQCRRIRNRKRRQRCLRKAKPKRMTMARAQSVAIGIAREVYLSPEGSWSDYDAGACERRTRSKVRCVVLVSEDFYSEYDGSYYDTIVCGAFADVYYDRRDRLRIWTSEPACFWESEL